jgi:hypothetical protein
VKIDKTDPHGKLRKNASSSFTKRIPSSRKVLGYTIEEGNGSRLNNTYIMQRAPLTPVVKE